MEAQASKPENPPLNNIQPITRPAPLTDLPASTIKKGKHQINDSIDDLDENEPVITNPTTATWLDEVRGKVFNNNGTAMAQKISQDTVQYARELKPVAIPYQFVTSEAAMTDRILKGIVANLQVCDQKLNLGLEQSQELAERWVFFIAEV